MVHGSIRFCNGCPISGCQGFFKFVDNGIYDEPDYLAHAKYCSHEVTVLRVGNRE